MQNQFRAGGSPKDVDSQEQVNSPAAQGIELFEQICSAAGIEPGIQRIGVFLALPAETQNELWVDAARHEHVGSDASPVPTPEKTMSSADLLGADVAQEVLHAHRKNLAVVGLMVDETQQVFADRPSVAALVVEMFLSAYWEAVYRQPFTLPAEVMDVYRHLADEIRGDDGA